MTQPAPSSASAVPSPALATPSRLEPSPKNEVALTIPATFNFAVGVVDPTPTLLLDASVASTEKTDEF